MVEISTLAPPEWQQYKDLRLQALREEPGAFSSTYNETYSNTDEYWQTRLMDAQQQEKSWIFFAKQESKLVGMVSANGADHNSIQVHGVFVAREFRGNRIGKLLMDTLISKIAQNSRYEKLYLDVNAEQVAAVNLYQSCGFQIVDELYETLGDNKKHLVYVMYKELGELK
jgi:ribosomal protein S18 acetylase RimI-like enzyme